MIDSEALGSSQASLANAGLPKPHAINDLRDLFGWSGGMTVLPSSRRTNALTPYALAAVEDGQSRP